MARRRRIRERIEEAGGLRIANGSPPGWLMLVIIGIVTWGLFYLITYSITDTGTFQAPGFVARLLAG